MMLRRESREFMGIFFLPNSVTCTLGEMFKMPLHLHLVVRGVNTNPSKWMTPFRFFCHCYLKKQQWNTENIKLTQHLLHMYINILYEHKDTFVYKFITYMFTVYKFICIMLNQKRMLSNKVNAYSKHVSSNSLLKYSINADLMSFLSASAWFGNVVTWGSDIVHSKCITMLHENIE